MQSVLVLMISSVCCGCKQAEDETKAMILSDQEVNGQELTVFDKTNGSDDRMAQETSGSGSECMSQEEQTSSEGQQLAKQEQAVQITPAISVYVCGAVLHAGVYELHAGARVNEAVLMAGGLNENAAEWYLNLATVLTDGEKIYVPTTEELEAQNKTGMDLVTNTQTKAAGQDQTADLIDINTASAEQLTAIPGIGVAKANSIIAYRETKGAFQKPEDIMNVEGIKEGMYQKMKDYMIVR